ncbi:hypothetical protein [Rhodocyclus tenuis]|uniref:NUDIX hydrolase n=1 Tax=Rhodocyclus tenuis TaxID=1066 RepID=A0A840G8U1_RHOTE|nr:hypothetical protein [Rhodocyclus tenuis]MBB4248753.1 hypothetical protein [Rhodocyclus tenuis]
MSISAGAPAAVRLILYHQQSSSARTRFLRLRGGLLAFDALPEGAHLLEGGTTPVAGTVRLHPAAALRSAEQRLGIADGSLRANSEFNALLQTDAGEITVLLAAFTTLDLPRLDPAIVGDVRFVALTELRDLPPLELALARLAYEAILG